ncbi:MAG: tyrosine-type recombinase/integrase [Clostridiales bacterium]|nr:tyrosine-type recombinase/integrase [Clostridiales bacterium]
MTDLSREFEDYIIYCSKQRGLSGHTLKAYKIDMKQFVSYTGFISLERNDLTKYIQHLHENYKPKTVRRKIASLKAFFHYLYYRDVISENPFGKINTGFKEPKTLPKTIPCHIIQNILEALYDDITSSSTKHQKEVSVRNAAVIELLFATGARISEICSLKTEDVELSSHTVKIFGKGSKERIIQVENAGVINILEAYKKAYEKKLTAKGFFFLNNRGHRLSEQSVRNIIRRLEAQVNSPIHITPHMFRHSVATLLLEENVDIRYIQKILGHSSITTTQIYTHVTSSKQREILRTKHPRNKMNIKSYTNYEI